MADCGFRSCLAVATVGLALAGCASAGTAAPAASSRPEMLPAVQPANPVPILKRAGATTQAVSGQADIYGDRYATGEIGDEEIDVYTFADKAAQQADLDRNPAQDGEVTIRGPLFDASVHAIQTVTGWRYPVSPETIARRIGGTLVR